MVNIALLSTHGGLDKTRFQELSEAITHQLDSTEITEKQVATIYEKITLDQKLPLPMVLLNIFRYARNMSLIVLGRGNFVTQLKTLEDFGIATEKVGLTRWTSVGGNDPSFNLETKEWLFGGSRYPTEKKPQHLDMENNDGGCFKICWKDDKDNIIVYYLLGLLKINLLIQVKVVKKIKKNVIRLPNHTFSVSNLTTLVSNFTLFTNFTNLYTQ